MSDEMFTTRSVSHYAVVNIVLASAPSQCVRAFVRATIMYRILHCHSRIIVLYHDTRKRKAGVGVEWSIIGIICLPCLCVLRIQQHQEANEFDSTPHFRWLVRKHAIAEHPPHCTQHNRGSVAERAHVFVVETQEER